MYELEPVLEATFEHLLLVYGSLALGVFLSIPLAIASVYNRYLASLVVAFSNLLQALPSFAVVALVVPLMGIGFKPAVIAILVRVLLPIIKNTYIGLSSVDPSILDSARGIGLTDWQIMRKIRFPNAYPAFFAGIKFASILANGIAILTAIIGSGGLGSLVFEGLAQHNQDKVIAGALPAVIVALLTDLSFSRSEKKFKTLHIGG